MLEEEDGSGGPTDLKRQDTDDVLSGLNPLSPSNPRPRRIQQYAQPQDTDKATAASLLLPLGPAEIFGAKP